MQFPPSARGFGLGTLTCLGMLACISLGAPPAFAQDARREGDLWQKQEATRKQFAELESKLRRVAYMLQNSQPKQAARLRRALDQSNEEGIVDVLLRVESLLKNGDSTAASVSQSEAIEAMERVLFVLEQELEEEQLDPEVLERMLEEVRKLKDAEEKQLEETREQTEAAAQVAALEQAAKRVRELIELQKKVIGRTNEADTDEDLSEQAESQRAVAGEAAAAQAAIAGDPAAQGQPGEGQPGEGQPGEGQPGEGQPGEGQPGEGQPGEGQPGSGQPGSGQPGSGQPGSGQPGEGQPGSGQPGEGQPGSGQPGSGQPSEQGIAPTMQKAAQAVEQAKKAMEEAAGRLDEDDRDPALERERAALEALEDAQADLERKKAEIERLAGLERRISEQERTRSEAEDLSRRMKGGGAGGQPSQGGGQPGGGSQGGGGQQQAPGQRNIERAEEAMERAGDNMANRYEEQTEENQQEAVEQLQQAEEVLEEALMQARRREQEAILRALGQRFQAMLEQQREITRGTEKVKTGMGERKRLDRRERQLARRLAEGKTDAQGAVLEPGELLLKTEASLALELVREEGSTAILPIVIEELVYDFDEVAGLLKDGHVNGFVIQLQKDIERSLEELIEVIKKEIEQRGGGGGGGGGQQGGPPDENGEQLLPPSAELKMIRVQQLRVNDLTETFDLDRTEAEDLNPEQRQACDHISEKQGRVAEFTRRLHERLNKER